MTINKSQQKAVAKYNLSNYDRIELRVEKGKKQVIKNYAASEGLSLNSFVNKAIDEKMERKNVK